VKSIINKFNSLISFDKNCDYELAQFFDVSLDLLCIADFDGKILKVNKAWQKTLNFLEKDFVNSLYLNYVHEDDKSKTVEAMEILKSEGRLLNFVNRYRTKNGTYKYIEWKSQIYNNFIYAAGSDVTDKILAQQKLRESESTYKLIFENSPLGILHYNNHGIITEINDNFADIIGSRKKVLVGLNMIGLKDKRISEAVKNSLEKSLVSKLEIVYAAETSDKVMPVRIVFAPVFSSLGELSGGVGIVEDISERVESEKKVKENLEKYLFLFEQAADGILIGNEKGIIIDANPSICKMSGYSRNEILGNHISFLFSDAVVEKKPFDFDSVLSGKTILTQRTLKRKDGSPIFIEMNTKKVGDGRLQTYIRDVTERITAQEKLRKSEEDLRITLDSIGDAVIAADTDFRITKMNPVAEKMTGWKLEDALGHEISEVFDIRDSFTSEKAHNPVYAAIETGKNIELKNSTILFSKDGNEYYISDSASPIKDKNSNIVGAVLVFRDVTEQYVLKERLRHSEKMEAIGQLTGGIAHDYNNMLSGIFGGIELLEKAQTPEEISKYIEVIKMSALRTSELNEKLLSFGRKTELIFSPVNINEAVENTIDILKYTLDRKISIKYEKDRDDIFVNGSLSQLQNVFMNLGINSGFAMKNGGTLQFETSLLYLDENYLRTVPGNLSPGYYALINVSDEGEGIPLKYQARIFEPFFTTKDKDQGSGLGLATAYGIITEHKGIISFYSEENTGTVFHIYLPVIESSEPVSDKKAEPFDALTGSGTILLVEDEEIVRTTVSAMLSEIGFNVLEAENGRTGYEVYKKNSRRIDVVILDMIMPEMNGKECFYAIRKFDPDAKIILSSGYSREEDFIELKEHGLNGFIKKPFYISELGKIVNRLINS
jgi:PAS domain S-box-containing protein